MVTIFTTFCNISRQCLSTACIYVFYVVVMVNCNYFRVRRYLTALCTNGLRFCYVDIETDRVKVAVSFLEYCAIRGI